MTSTTNADTSRPTTGLRPNRRLSHGAAFWATAAVFLSAMAFAAVPTPLYALYQARDGYPAWTTTVIFAVYAVGVAASLYFIGHLGDRVGRRPLAFAAIGFEFAAAALFIASPTLTGLLIARVLTGLGVGALTASATAQLAELRSVAKPGSGGGVSAAVATLANIGGIGCGPLVSGLLAQFVPAPLVTPYLVSLVVLVLAAVVVVVTPETVARPAVLPKYHPQRVAVPPERRAEFAAAGAAALASFAIFGLFTALAPGFLANEFDSPSRLAAGLVPFSVFASAALTQVFFSKVAVRTQLVVAVVLMLVGLVALAVSAIAGLLWLFVASGIIAGAGVGLLFRSAVGLVAGLVPPSGRGEALAALFLTAYVGISIPVIAVGVALIFFPAVGTLVVFAALIAVLVAICGLRMIRSAGVTS